MYFFPRPQRSASEENSQQLVSQALAMIAKRGVFGVEMALIGLSEAGIDLLSGEGQPVLTGALFQLIEGLEEEPDSAAIRAVIAALDPEVALAAIRLVSAVSIVPGRIGYSELSSETRLCLALLSAVATGPGVDHSVN